MRTPFPIHDWQRAVAAAATRTGTDAIGPFGFELTCSRSYLFSHLRYLFIYIVRLESLPGRDRVIGAMQEALRDTLPEVANSVEMIDYDRHVVRTEATTGSRTLIIRSVDTRKALLPTWARYVVATALSPNRERITAATRFHLDLMAQRYCCQLAIMHDALISSLWDAPRLEHHSLITSHLSRLQRVGLEAREDVAMVDSTTTQKVDEAIRCYYAKLNGFLHHTHTGGDYESVPDFHGRELLDLPVNAHSEQLVEDALKRYRAFVSAVA